MFIVPTFEVSSRPPGPTCTWPSMVRVPEPCTPTCKVALVMIARAFAPMFKLTTTNGLPTGVFSTRSVLVDPDGPENWMPKFVTLPGATANVLEETVTVLEMALVINTAALVVDGTPSDQSTPCSHEPLLVTFQLLVVPCADRTGPWKIAEPTVKLVLPRLKKVPNTSKIPPPLVPMNPWFLTPFANVSVPPLTLALMVPKFRVLPVIVPDPERKFPVPTLTDVAWRTPLDSRSRLPMVPEPIATDGAITRPPNVTNNWLLGPPWPIVSVPALFQIEPVPVTTAVLLLPSFGRS